MWHWWHEETPFETTKYPSRLSPCQGYWSVFGKPLFSILPGPKLFLTLELRNGLVSYLGWPCLCWILGESPQIWDFLILFPNYQWPSTTHTSPWHPRALPIKASEGPQDLKVLVGWFPWKLTWIDYLTNLYYHGSWATFDVCLTTQHGEKKTSHWSSLKLPANSFIRLAHVPARPPSPNTFQL